MEFLRNADPLGRNAVKVISRMEAIRIPLTRPNPTPQRRSTQPKNAMFKRYLMMIPKIPTIIRTLQNMIRKLSMLRYAVSFIRPDSNLPTVG